MQWLGGLPPDQFEMAMPQAIIHLAESDPFQAAGLVSDWPSALPKSSISEIAAGLFAADPAGAFEWADAIQDADNRRYALSRLYAEWVDINPEAASEALAWVAGFHDPDLHNQSLKVIAPSVCRSNPDYLSAWLQTGKSLSSK